MGSNVNCATSSGMTASHRALRPVGVMAIQIRLCFGTWIYYLSCHVSSTWQLLYPCVHAGFHDCAGFCTHDCVYPRQIGQCGLSFIYYNLTEA
eukprot:184623-Prorocentrum_minimum.AAC.1